MTHFFHVSNSIWSSYLKWPFEETSAFTAQCSTLQISQNRRILMEEVIITDSSTRAATSWCRWPSTPSSTICPSSPSSPRSAPTSTPPTPPPTRRWPLPPAASRSWGLHPGISGQSIKIKIKLILKENKLNFIFWKLILNLKFYLPKYSVLNWSQWDRCLKISL